MTTTERPGANDTGLPPASDTPWFNAESMTPDEAAEGFIRHSAARAAARMSRETDPAHRPAMIQMRIAQFCQMTGAPVPTVEINDDGDVIANEALMTWIDEEGASLDWIVTGSPRALINSFRNSRRKALNVFEDFKKVLDDDEMKMFIAMLHACTDGPLDVKQAIDGFDAALRERRGDTRPPYTPAAKVSA